MNPHFHERLKEYIHISQQPFLFKSPCYYRYFLHILTANIPYITISDTCKSTKELVEGKKAEEKGKWFLNTSAHCPKQTNPLSHECYGRDSGILPTQIVMLWPPKLHAQALEPSDTLGRPAGSLPQVLVLIHRHSA